MKKLIFLFICLFTISLSANAQRETKTETKFVFEVSGRPVEVTSPIPVTPTETQNVLRAATSRDPGGILIPVHVYYYNHLTGNWDYQYSGYLYVTFATISDAIDFLLAIWDYL